jgi:hypothetical protein
MFWTVTCTPQVLSVDQALLDLSYHPPITCSFKVNEVRQDIEVPEVPPLYYCHGPDVPRKQSGRKDLNNACAVAKWFLHQVFNRITRDQDAFQHLFEKLTRDFINHKTFSRYGGEVIWVSKDRTDGFKTRGWRVIRPSEFVTKDFPNPPPAILLKNLSRMLCNRVGAAIANRYA